MSKRYWAGSTLPYAAVHQVDRAREPLRDQVGVGQGLQLGGDAHRLQHGLGGRCRRLVQRREGLAEREVGDARLLDQVLGLGHVVAVERVDAGIVGPVRLGVELRGRGRAAAAVEAPSTVELLSEHVDGLAQLQVVQRGVGGPHEELVLRERQRGPAPAEAGALGHVGRCRHVSGGDLGQVEVVPARTPLIRCAPWPRTAR